MIKGIGTPKAHKMHPLPIVPLSNRYDMLTTRQAPRSRVFVRELGMRRSRSPHFDQALATDPRCQVNESRR